MYVRCCALRWEQWYNPTRSRHLIRALPESVYMVKVRKTKPGYHWTFESQETLVEYVPTSLRLDRVNAGGGGERQKRERHRLAELARRDARGSVAAIEPATPSQGSNSLMLNCSGTVTLRRTCCCRTITTAAWRGLKATCPRPTRARTAPTASAASTRAASQGRRVRQHCSARR